MIGLNDNNHLNIFRNKSQIQDIRSWIRDNHLTLGFVPTMGALHEGHLSLIRRAKQENDRVLVSIFINPTQFNNRNDYKTYPRLIEDDLSLIKKEIPKGLIFIPNAEDIYDGNVISENFDFSSLGKYMESQYREGHFDGVATIIKHFFELIEPHKAYFGQKDYQQYRVIEELVKQKGYSTDIVMCQTIRESNGLAMSSRNKLLTDENFDKAKLIFKTLDEIRALFKKEHLDTVYKYVAEKFHANSDFELEYFIIANEKTLIPVFGDIDKNMPYRAFICVYIQGVRLIDNIALDSLS